MLTNDSLKVKYEIFFYKNGCKYVIKHCIVLKTGLVRIVTQNKKFVFAY